VNHVRTLFALLMSAFFIAQASAATFKPSGPAAYTVELLPMISQNGTPYMRPTQVLTGASPGAVELSDLIRSPGPAGQVIELTAKQKIPWGQVARVAGRAAGWIGAGMIAYDIYERMRVTPNPGGTGWQYDPGMPGIPGTKYKVQGNETLYADPLPGLYLFGDDNCAIAINGGWKNCQVTSVTRPSPLQGRVVISLCGTAQFPEFCTTSTFMPNITAVDSVFCPDGAAPAADGKCASPARVALTEDEATALMEQNAPKDQAREMLGEMLGAGAKIDMTPKPAVELTGPPKVELAPKTTTKTDAQGNVTTTTTQTVYNITYQGDTYSWTETTKVTNPDGSTEETEDPTPEEVAPPTDPSMPAVPDLYEQKYPEGLAGVWQAEAAALNQTPIFQFLQGLNPGIGGGGCPVWSWPTAQVLGISVGGDISVPCYVWSALRIIFTISALLLARKLIFGG